MNDGPVPLFSRDGGRRAGRPRLPVQVRDERESDSKARKLERQRAKRLAIKEGNSPPEPPVRWALAYDQIHQIPPSRKRETHSRTRVDEAQTTIPAEKSDSRYRSEAEDASWASAVSSTLVELLKRNEHLEQEVRRISSSAAQTGPRKRGPDQSYRTGHRSGVAENCFETYWILHLLKSAIGILPSLELATKKEHVWMPTVEEATSNSIEILECVYSGVPVVTTAPLEHVYRTAVEFIEAFDKHEERHAQIQDSAQVKGDGWHIACNKRISQMLARVQADVPSDQPWNWLDVRSIEPQHPMPEYLRRNDDANLLGLLQNDLISSQHVSNIQRIPLSATWSDVSAWALISEAGFPTTSHMDGNGYATYLTVVEGEVGFAWIYRPSIELLERWCRDGDGVTDARWLYVVLRPGDTVFFGPGTVHSVVRAARDLGNGHWGLNGRTFMTGGHVLRRSKIAQWAQLSAWQLKKEDEGLPITNEDMQATTVQLFEAIASRLRSVQSRVDAEKWGGHQAIQAFNAQAREVMPIMLKVKDDQYMQLSIPHLRTMLANAGVNVPLGGNASRERRRAAVNFLLVEFESLFQEP